MLYIKDLSIRFKTGPKVVTDMNMVIEEGEKRCILGETGSGKSILMQAIIKLLPPSAHISGEITYKDQDILSMNKKEINQLRRGELSYIPQGSGHGLNPLIKVKNQMIEKLGGYQKISRPEKDRIGQEALGKFGFSNPEEVINFYPHMLSGGMSQRVLIAMGVINNPNFILADEPTKGLDKTRINQVIESFKNLEDKTLLCVSHDLNFAREIASSISVMYASYELEMAPRDLFFEDPLHPYSQALLQALPENNLQVNMGFAPSKIQVEQMEGCLFYDRCKYKTSRCLTPPPMIQLDKRKVRCWIYAS